MNRETVRIFLRTSPQIQRERKVLYLRCFSRAVIFLLGMWLLKSRPFAGNSLNATCTKDIAVAERKRKGEKVSLMWMRCGIYVRRCSYSTLCLKSWRFSLIFQLTLLAACSSILHCVHATRRPRKKLFDEARRRFDRKKTCCRRVDWTIWCGKETKKSHVGGI